MTVLSKNMYIDRLDETVDKYKITYRTIKMKPVDVQTSMQINYGVKHNYKDPKFKVSGHVRISKYKNIFAKICTPNWFEEVFFIKEINNTAPWKNFISDLNDEEIVRTFYEKEMQRTS